ncbi:hypothetical protein GCM10009115_09120 [Sphingopyxis soli]|uniref:Terminase n=1 Tax=Sphingopyxis soli TaxID=592051 RepID=A0ABN1LZL6_9SPHN|nr:hypothetical protein [Sphingopyxis soli]
MNDNDLPKYPKGAGYRDDEASRDGARKVNSDGSRKSQSDFALALVEAAGPAGIIADTIFAAPDAPFSALALCRARLSELKKLGKIAKSGERRLGLSGIAVNVWVAARYVTEQDGQGDLFGSEAA